MLNDVGNYGHKSILNVSLCERNKKKRRSIKIQPSISEYEENVYCEITIPTIAGSRSIEVTC